METARKENSFKEFSSEGEESCRARAGGKLWSLLCSRPFTGSLLHPHQVHTNLLFRAHSTNAHSALSNQTPHVNFHPSSKDDNHVFTMHHSLSLTQCQELYQWLKKHKMRHRPSKNHLPVQWDSWTVMTQPEPWGPDVSSIPPRTGAREYCRERAGCSARGARPSSSQELILKQRGTEKQKQTMISFHAAVKQGLTSVGNRGGH